MTAIGWFILATQSRYKRHDVPFDSAQDDEFRYAEQFTSETNSSPPNTHLPSGSQTVSQDGIAQAYFIVWLQNGLITILFQRKSIDGQATQG
jgi:hypothetical protein